MNGPAPLWLSSWTLAAAFAATVLLGVLSALLERSGPIRLRHWAEKAGGRLLLLYDAPSSFEAFRLLLSLLARLAPVLLAWSLWSVLDGRLAGAFWTAVGSVVAALLLLEWLNRILVGRHAEDALSHLTGLTRFVHLVLAPGVLLLALVVPSGDDEDEDEEDEASDDEIDAYLDVGRREGILEPGEEELVRSIVDFGDTQVRSVMTPRVEMVSAPVEASLESLAQRFFESKHARLPLYEDNIDKIVGILHIRDLFEALHSDDRRGASAAELSNPPVYVPESKSLRELLTELQSLHQQMAIVVDEYGGVAGLVTVEDLVEEIVGDIGDEHEPRPGGHVQLADDVWRLPGRTDLEELDDLFDVELDDELPYETVSGLICGELGSVPKEGQTFERYGLLFTVEEADERRVLTVSVHRASVGESA